MSDLPAESADLDQCLLLGEQECSAPNPVAHRRRCPLPFTSVLPP